LVNQGWKDINQCGMFTLEPDLEMIILLRIDLIKCVEDQKLRSQVLLQANLHRVAAEVEVQEVVVQWDLDKVPSFK
jgi:hypothetical protein